MWQIQRGRAAGQAGAGRKANAETRNGRTEGKEGKGREGKGREGKREHGMKGSNRRKGRPLFRWGVAQTSRKPCAKTFWGPTAFLSRKIVSPQRTTQQRKQLPVDSGQVSIGRIKHSGSLMATDRQDMDVAPTCNRTVLHTHRLVI